ncbi:hypothetical protein Tco_1359562 [Tanacetum coccineum]
MSKEPWDKATDNPSLANILHKYVFIHSNTIIQRDGKVQSFCGLKIANIGATCAGRAPYTFRINGQNYHHIGYLLPKEGIHPRTKARQYNKPTVAEVVALIINDFGDGLPTRDIIMDSKYIGPKRILELHPSYMALQYPFTLSQTDDIISAEIPCQAEDLEGYKVVTEFMVHGPCETIIDADGYPIYRRRDNKSSAMKGKFKGPKEFAELMTVNKRICSSFKEACSAYGLLNDDKEWTHAISEASFWALGLQLRHLFVTILIFRDVSRPLKLWNENWEAMSEDILHKNRKLFKYPELQLSNEQIHNYCLLEIQELLNRNGRDLSDF